MGKFYQVNGAINEENRYIHENNIYIVSSVTELINRSCSNEGYSVIYDVNTLNTTTFTEFDDFPHHTKFVSYFINLIISFDNKFDDRDDYLVLLLKSLKSDIFDNYNLYSVEERLAIKKVFTNLDLFDFFDKISSDFLKAKLNYYLEKL